tara:strand:- start:400 stop:2400 length:2001 start_codon:yes stop_codon:yes gene_type:complete
MRYVGLSVNKGKGGGGSVKTEEFTRSSGITTDSSNNVTEITLGDKVYTDVKYDAGGVGVVTGFTETINGVSKMWDITYDSEFLVTSIDQYIPPPPPTPTWPVNLNSISWSGKAPHYKFNNVEGSSTHGTTRGFFLKPDGTAIFTMGNDKRIRKHTMSTPFDISTASYDSMSSTGLYASSGYSKGLYFKPDGTRVFWIDKSDIRYGDLSTAWDLSTFSYQSGQNLSGWYTGGSGGNAETVTFTFKPDGTKFYIAESGSQIGGWTGSTSYSNILEFNLSTAWDINSYSYVQTNTTTFNGASHYGYLNGISFSSSGDKLFYCSGSNTYGFQCTLSTPWDISTAVNPGSFSTYYQTVSSFSGNGLNFQWKSDGSVYYFIGSGGSGNDLLISQMEPNNAWTIGGAVNSQDTPANDSDYIDWCHPANLFGAQSNYGASWNDDGTKLYYTSSYTVKIIPVTTAYDIKTITTTGQSMTGTQLGYGPKSIRFKPDGTRFWLGPEVQNGVVGQYEIPTPWDLNSVPNNGNTAGYTYTLSVSGVTGAFVSDDGVNIYHSNSSGAIYWHRCSTAWDLSSASYQGNISGLPATANQFIMSDDGTTLVSMFSNSTNNTVYKFTLSSAWDITTLNTTPDQTLDMNTLGIPHYVLVGSCWCYGDGKWFIFPYYGAHGYVLNL